MNDLALRTRRVIAIDGPAASGKSTTAAAVADRLGFAHLNSGLLYRAFAWRTLREGWDETAESYASRIAGVAIEFRTAPDGLQLYIDGESPGEALHGRDVAARVSAVASVACVRVAVFEQLRAAAGHLDLVCDGRDIGTTVFPGADLKIYLVADASERARRRLLDFGDGTDEEKVIEEAERLRRRDEADATRELSPLRKASDAIEIDTTSTSAPDVVDRILALAKQRGMPPRRGIDPRTPLDSNLR
ncbi:MAG: (d)CMP kinase [Gemmatimonadota bacterium]|nr:(d)CMP kinase [Gemmatimonadota bacterium]